MKTFEGKVAVVTGAASGIGRAISERCASEGMKTVLADYNESALAQTQSEVEESGAEVHAVVADVSKIEDVEMLAERALSISGKVDFLCNNAGIGAAGDFLRTPLSMIGSTSCTLRR